MRQDKNNGGGWNERGEKGYVEQGCRLILPVLIEGWPVPFPVGKGGHDRFHFLSKWSGDRSIGQNLRSPVASIINSIRRAVCRRKYNYGAVVHFIDTVHCKRHYLLSNSNSNFYKWIIFLQFTREIILIFE